MKKTYTKPALYIEQFTFSQSIAAGCGILQTYPGTEVNSGTIQTCGIDFYGTLYFQSGVTNCTAGEFDEICYNSPSEEYALFAS